jgi:hypothetical protein
LPTAADPPRPQDAAPVELSGPLDVSAPLDISAPIDVRGKRVWPVRLGVALVVGVYLAYSSFGIAGYFLWGHHGYHGATYMQRAKMTLRFGLVTPTTAWGYEQPTWASYYFHHPIGYHHLLDLPILIFGDHEWVARGVAAAGGLFTLWALFALVRRWWSREWALLAIAIYVALPVITSFSVLSDPMLLEMACAIAIVNIYLRYLQDPKRKRLLWACAAFVAGGLLMWEVYFEALFLAIAASFWMLSSRARQVGRWAAGKWILATGLASGAVFAFHFLYILHVHMMADFRSSFHERSNASFDFALSRHKQWLEILYGRPVVYIGFAWMAVFLCRLALKKARWRDQAVWMFFQINTLYIALFVEASAVHLYRVFFYSTFLTLATVDLIGDAYSLTGWLLRGRGRLTRRVAVAVAVVLIGGFFAIDGPHALHNLIESREVMGTHGLPGYNADYPKQLFAMEVAKRTGPKDFVFIHDSLPKRVEFYYYMDRSTSNIYSLSQLPALLKVHPRALVLLDANPVGAERKLMLDLLRKHPAFRFDRYLLIDLRSTRPEFG